MNQIALRATIGNRSDSTALLRIGDDIYTGQVFACRLVFQPIRMAAELVQRADSNRKRPDRIRDGRVRHAVASLANDQL